MKKNLVITILVCFFCNSCLSQNFDSDRIILNYQIGKWVDDKEQKTSDNRIYKFGYELKWFDRNKTIIKIHVTGIFNDGEIRTFWEGFKHWSAKENKMLYNGFSPDGRIVNGYLIINEKEIITHYSSNTPNGMIYIKDVAEKINDNHFTTTTYLKREKEDWKIVNKDNWSRVE